MKKPLFLKLVSLMLLAVLLVLTGCQQANIPVPDASSQAPATDEPAATTEPVVTPTLAPTAPAPTATIEVPASPIPTVEATATPTPTPAASATPAASGTPVPVGNSKYTLYVYVRSQLVVCYDSTGTPVKVMICSTGTSSTPSPIGTFKLGRKNSTRHLDGAFGQYCSNIVGGIWFHSTPIAETVNGGKGIQFSDATKETFGKACVRVGAYNQLGNRASHGCVRMLVGDAAWIYYNCPSGIDVHIVSDKYSGKKVGYTSPPSMKSSYPYRNKYKDDAFGNVGWDPTDPDSRNPYKGGGGIIEPSATPVVTPTPTPDVTPTQTPDPTPTQEPDPTPTKEPDPTPTKEPDPTPTKEPDPTPTQEPDPTPDNPGE